MLKKKAVHVMLLKMYSADAKYFPMMEDFKCNRNNGI